MNFATEKATVTFDEWSCSLEIIKNVIKNAGYKPIEKTEKNSVLVCPIFSLPLKIGGNKE